MDQVITEYLTSKELRKIKKSINAPVRNLEKNKKIMDYIKKHGVYGSMTSSPERLRKASTVLSVILTNPYIKKLYINLPKKYRNKDPYNKADVKYIESIDSRIKVRWLDKDIGPISKILPTLQKMKDKKAIVISFDDDVFYPPALINELIYYSIRYPHLIPGGAGFSFGDMEDVIKRKNWPENRKPKFPDVDIIEGWGSIAYRKEMVDLNFIKKLNNLGTVCKLSDDLTLSYSHSNYSVKRKLISNKYYSANEDVFPLGYGLGEGALHKGSGTEHTDAVDANMIKYKECIDLISEK
jgi:hypothetical protein